MPLPVKIVVLLSLSVLGFALAKIAIDYIVVPLNIAPNPVMTVGIYAGFILAFVILAITLMTREE